jgi:hypothetical protein
MRLKIYTVHHYVPEYYVDSDIFRPFVTGQSVGRHTALVTDERGDNIAHKTGYSEMRAQYYVWRNLLACCDYVGFQHYRRYFFFDQLPILSRHRLFQRVRSLYLANPHLSSFRVSADGFRNYMQALQNLRAPDCEVLRDLIGRHDIVALRPTRVSLASQYRDSHSSEDWDALMLAVGGHSFFNNRASFLAADLNIFYNCNMYIMRASEFDAYMSFWLEAMLALEQVVKPGNDVYQSRVFGFLSERLFTLYLYQLRMERPALRLAELAYLQCPDFR